MIYTLLHFFELNKYIDSLSKSFVTPLELKYKGVLQNNVLDKDRPHIPDDTTIFE